MENRVCGYGYAITMGTDLPLSFWVHADANESIVCQAVFQQQIVRAVR